MLVVAVWCKSVISRLAHALSGGFSQPSQYTGLVYPYADDVGAGIEVKLSRKSRSGEKCIRWEGREAGGGEYQTLVHNISALKHSFGALIPCFAPLQNLKKASV